MRRRERTRGNFCFWYHSGTSSGTNDHMWDIKMKETSEMSPFEKKKKKKNDTPGAGQCSFNGSEGTEIQDRGKDARGGGWVFISTGVQRQSFLDACMLISTLVGDDLRPSSRPPPGPPHKMSRVR